MRTLKYWLLLHSGSNSRFVMLTGEIEKRIDWRKMDVWILSVCVWHTVYKYTYNLSRSRRIYFPFIFYNNQLRLRLCDVVVKVLKLVHYIWTFLGSPYHKCYWRNATVRKIQGVVNDNIPTRFQRKTRYSYFSSFICIRLYVSLIIW